MDSFFSPLAATPCGGFFRISTVLLYWRGLGNPSHSRYFLGGSSRSDLKSAKLKDARRILQSPEHYRGERSDLFPPPIENGSVRGYRT
ncbi:MAG TPA: hypothetical protein VJJ55_01335 [Candidatus Paceibacterota bacterium]